MKQPPNDIKHVTGNSHNKIYFVPVKKRHPVVLLNIATAWKASAANHCWMCRTTTLTAQESATYGTTNDIIHMQKYPCSIVIVCALAIAKLSFLFGEHSANRLQWFD